ncbi:hypothetical protein GT019_10590 [Paenibacillus sp. T1]|uniref:YqbQ/XkdQ domain-containing protein n=1 Tax=Paenibacillus glycinis TaxID=2697035 RepID=A0ABW9XP74_9BACL|nr:hypothetical protein [Paenibacillus glycinis]
MFEATIDNRDGTLWDISELCSEITYKTSRVGKPSSADVTLVGQSPFQDKKFAVANGDILKIRVDGQGMFFGYVFKIGGGRDGEIKLTAYDQIRYLNETDTYVATNVTAEQVIRDNCAVGGLRIGELAKTNHVLPKVLEDGQKRLDMIYRALDSAMLATGRLYVFYDDFGSLQLRDIADMKLSLILGDDSLVYDYGTTRSIDEDTYNHVKLVQDNKTSGKRDAYYEWDSSTMAKWGRLHYYQKVDDGMNEAQIRNMAAQVLKLKNRETVSFSLEALGFVGLRAGMAVQVTIAEQQVDSFYLVEECTHKLSGDSHTMSLEMKVFG